MSCEQDLVDFLAKLKLSRCREYLVQNNVTSLDSLKKLPVNDLKAIGFRTEVRSRIQKSLNSSEPDTEYFEEEKYVTVDEEEEAAIQEQSKPTSAKKKKKSKGAYKHGGSSSSNPVPGEDGSTLEPQLEQLLSTLGLSECAPVFQRNNITSLASCRFVTKEALVGNFGVPSEKAGLLLSYIISASPGVAQERRLPELAPDLDMIVSSLNLPEIDRRMVKTALQTNEVLSVRDAKAKRFAMMNELGLSADAATELGRLLDAGPVMPHHMPNSYQQQQAAMQLGGGSASGAQYAYSYGLNGQLFGQDLWTPNQAYGNSFQDSVYWNGQHSKYAPAGPPPIR
uniref:Ephrin receptor 1 SAM domain-containing protein n=2 Tax=Guillardia theta TaxID=55529 RepID=A0A7S4KG17_GUITH|mmetsp:Transcript_24308/g.79350  ORF Transcript_24308/g.79350 Transcript_24308/m.79350 type:complete len:339 (+) Transcript_24308:86-1102(+)